MEQVEVNGTQSDLDMGDGMGFGGDEMGEMELEPRPSPQPTQSLGLSCSEIKPLGSALACLFPHVADICRRSGKSKKHLSCTQGPPSAPQ